MMKLALSALAAVLCVVVFAEAMEIDPRKQHCKKMAYEETLRELQRWVHCRVASFRKENSRLILHCINFLRITKGFR